MSAAPRTKAFIYTASPMTPADGDLETTTKDLLDGYMQDNQPLVHLSFDAAADEARMAGPSEEDAEEWITLLEAQGPALDSRSDVSAATRPRYASFVHELGFGDIRVETTDDLDRPLHLDFRADHPEIDALWLPNADQAPRSGSLRIITSRSLADHFDYIATTTVPARSRRRR